MKARVRALLSIVGGQRLALPLLLAGLVAGITVVSGTRPIAAEPSFGVDLPSGPPAATILEPAPGSPQLGPIGAPVTTIAPAAIGLGGVPVAVRTADDISFGNDFFPPAGPWHLAFSVAPGSIGHPASGAPISPMYPNVLLEGPFLAGGDGSVAGDIYSSYNMAAPAALLGAYAFAGPPAAPCVPIHNNIQVADDDGLVPALAPNVGLGLAPGVDNLNSLDMSDNGVVDFIPAGGNGIPDAPIFFTVDAGTAAALGALPPGGLVTPASVLVWDPVAAALFNWAPAGALALAPGDNIDALAVGYVSGAPLAAGWIGGGDTIMFSLAPGSPSLPVLPSFCFGPGTGTAGDIYVKFAPGPALAFPAVDAEMMGLSEFRSGGPVADNVDAIDIVLSSLVDSDADFIDDAVDMDDDNDGLGDMRDAAAGCSPVMADTDGDGLTDYTEVVVLGTSCSSPDTDGDGCSDPEELGANEALGGLRDPLSSYDFFDTNGDRVIDLFNDIFDVVNAFGLTTSDPGYSTLLDRSAPAPGMDVWDMQAPDGVIDLFTDIFGVAYQFGHDCSAAP